MRLFSLIATTGTLALLAPAASSMTVRAPGRPSISVPRTGSRPMPLAARRRTTTTASCANGARGTGSVDSTLTLEQSTGGGTSGFAIGNTTLAAAAYSSIQGSHNTICDYDSSIDGGYQNVIDSGSGNTPTGAYYSGIGGGTENTISAQESFIGAGYQNSIAFANAFIGSGTLNMVLVGGELGFIGAGYENSIDAHGAAVIAGGTLGGGNASMGQDSMIGTGDENEIASAEDAFIGAGEANIASGDGSAIVAGGTVSGGNKTTGTDSFVAAGDGNQANSTGSFVGAGSNNVASGAGAAIGGGDGNSALSQYSFIGSGSTNVASSAAEFGAVIGGQRNMVSAEYSTVLGGFGNTASGEYSIVAGGDANLAAGTLSYVGGYHAEADHSGSFVWSDYVSGSTKVKDSSTNQFVVRASGGTFVYSNEGATAGVKLAPGSGTWSSLSDRNAKTDVTPLDDASVLAKVNALPVSTWRYRSERGVRHAGPMAQDFYAAFGVGEDDRHITSIDEDGIALAAIKALHRENVQQKAAFSAQIGELRAENAQLRAGLAALASEVRASRESVRR